MPQVGIINPSEFSPLNSIEQVVWWRWVDVARYMGQSQARLPSTIAKHGSLGLSRSMVICSRCIVCIGHFVLPQGLVGLAKKLMAKFKRQNRH